MSVNNNVIHCAIGILAVLPTKDETPEQYLDQMSKNLNTVKTLLDGLEKDVTSKCSDTVTVQFVQVAVRLLHRIANTKDSDDVASMISIQQQQKIKILLQLIVSLGICPGLISGVNIPLFLKTKQLRLLIDDKRTTLQNTKTLWLVMPSIVELLNAPNLRSLVLAHLGDILAALLQILHAKMKKLDQTFGAVVTPKGLQALSKLREVMAENYKDMMNEIYRPLIIKELMLLLMPSGLKGVTAPRWLVAAVTKQLTEFLLSPGGVAVTLRAFCPSNNEPVDWKKVDSMSNLISLVHGSMDPDQFYSIISPQVISILNTTGAYCLPVAKMCIKKFFERDPERCNKYIFDQMFEPFILCSKPVGDKFSGVLISEESLSRCIDHINKCFTPGSQQSELPFQPLSKIMKIKWKLYLTVNHSVYQHKLAIQDLLVRFLYSESDIDKLTLIYNALLFKEFHPQMLDMSDDLEFQFGPSGGVQVAKRQNVAQVPIQREFISSFEYACDSMLDLLLSNETYGKKLVFDFFVVLINSLILSFDNSDEPPVDLKDPLFDTVDLIWHVIKKKEKKMMVIKLLASLPLTDSLVKSISKEPAIMLKFMLKYLNLQLDDLESGVVEDLEEEYSADVAMALRIIDIITVGLKTGSEDWNMMEPLLVPLQRTKTIFPESVGPFAGLLYERIMTKGAVHKNYLRDLEKIWKINMWPEEEKPAKEIERKLITEITDSDMEKARVLINSEDCPSIGHGLILLEKLIRKKDPMTMSSLDQIVIMLRKSLDHQDTYVYLSAIACYATLASVRNPEKELEFLCEEFVGRQKECSEAQLKIGEVLVKMVRVSQNPSPSIKHRLINTFLLGAKSPDEFLRASSLSNIAEVFKHVGYSSDPIIYEVLICIKSVVSHDESSVVRRAAVLLVNYLLQGCAGDDFLKRLESVLAELYKILLRARDADSDEVVRCQARSALEQLNAILKKQILKELPLEKRISILSLPH